MGQHPYLTAGTELVDDDGAHGARADPAAASTSGATRTGRRPVDGSPYDFRAPRAIGDLVLDTAYTDLAPGDDGRVRVRLGAPDGGGVGAVGRAGDPLAAGVHRGHAGAGPAAPQRGRGADVLPARTRSASGADLVVLDPGEEHALEWGLHGW